MYFKSARSSYLGGICINPSVHDTNLSQFVIPGGGNNPNPGPSPSLSSRLSPDPNLIQLKMHLMCCENAQGECSMEPRVNIRYFTI